MRTQGIAVGLTVINLVLLLSTLGPGPVNGAQAVTPVLRGRALELIDERGQIRSRLNVESNGEVVFRPQTGEQGRAGALKAR